MTNNVVQNALVYAFISLANQGATFGLWLLLAWWLAPSQIGTYALLMFVVELFGIIAIFGMDAAITRFYHSRNMAADVLSNALAIIAGACVLVFILFLSASPVINHVVPELSDFMAGQRILILISIFSNTLANFIFSHYTSMKLAPMYAWMQLFRTMTFAGLSLFFVSGGSGIEGIFLALICSSLTLVVIFLVNERRNILGRSVSGRLMRDMLSYGFPMMLYGATGIVITYFGRIALNASTNLATLGIYSFFLMITMQVSGLWGSINRAWTPEIFSLMRNQREQALEKVKRFAFLASFLYLGTLLIFIFIGEWFLFKLVLKQIYLENIHLLYILLLSPVFTGIYTASYPLFYYENKTTLILMISFIISPINILVTLALVRFFSQNGAAESYLLTSSLSTILYLFVFRKIGNVPTGIIRITILLTCLGCLSVWALLQESLTLFYISNIIGLWGIYRMGMLSSEISFYLNRLRHIGIFPR